MITWNTLEPVGTSIIVRARSSNNISWSAWEETNNGAPLHLTPAGRYLQVMVKFTSTVKNISPLLYDITITPVTEAPINNTDLGLTILTDMYTPTVNETVKIILHAGNNGPDDATGVQVNYRLPFGLEYQSTNGIYNHSTGLWTVGYLASGTTTTLEITAKIINSGSIVNTGTITGTEYDPNATNNQAELTVNIPYHAFKEELPEVPPNLQIKGEPTFPPIPNIEELMDIDPNEPKSEYNPVPFTNTPGPAPNSLSTPDTQLARDIASVRDIISRGNSLEQAVLPSWDINPNALGDDNNRENDEWKSFLVKFAGEAIFFAVLSSIPNEYLQQVRNSFLTSFETLGNILRYLGFGKQVKQIAGLWERTKLIINIPFTQDIISKLDALINVLDFSLGMTLLERALIKIFPNAATEIKLLMTTISTANLTYDGGETFKAIFSIINSMLTKNIPHIEDLSKLL